MKNSLTLRRPDDWHLHLRDQQMLASVAPHSARLGRAIIMPNLVPPVRNAAEADAYRQRILAARRRLAERAEELETEDETLMRGARAQGDRA